MTQLPSPRLRARWAYPFLAATIATATAMPLTLGTPYSSSLWLAAALLGGALGYVVGSREDELMWLSALDPSTGLLRRRHFERLLESELAGQPARVPFSLLLLDVDSLKAINHQRGREVGDAVIREVADALLRVCRDEDLAVRWGGDEFIVLARSTGPREAAALAQRILDTLRSSSKLGPEVSVSIGFAVANVRREGAPLRADRLVAAADGALHLAKSRGVGAVSAEALQGQGDSSYKSQLVEASH